MYDRDRLLHAIDLAALADELLGEHHGSGRSSTWACPNPEHPQTGRTPPVSIFTSRNGFERWHCHGCGDGGTAIDLVMSTTGCDVRDALEDLAGRTGVDRSARTTSRRPVRRPPPRQEPPATIADPDGLEQFVDDCARRLWTPSGRSVRRWLTEGRGLDPDVLERNRIGADVGAEHQPRPEGMPAAGRAAVLPIHRDGAPVFAQIRTMANGRVRYLNASSALAPNPRLGLYHPVTETGSCVLVTEGIIDALSVASAGLRGVALLGASVPDPDRSPSASSHPIVDLLAAMPGRLVLALDNDAAGHLATERLEKLLASTRPDLVRLDLPDGVNDINDWTLADPDLGCYLEERLRDAIDHPPLSARAL